MVFKTFYKRIVMLYVDGYTTRIKFSLIKCISLNKTIFFILVSNPFFRPIRFLENLNFYVMKTVSFGIFLV